MEDVPRYTLLGPPRSGSSSTAAHAVMEVNTYDQLEQHLVSFLASNEHLLLRTACKRTTDWWGIGVTSAVRRAVEAVDPDRRGKVIWVKLPYERLRGWTLRTVQRRVAEGVLGVDAAKELMGSADEDDDYSGVRVSDRGVVGDVSRRISRELTGMGTFLLVMQNWWEDYSPDLEDLGVPMPSRWSPRGFKIILWDPIFYWDEEKPIPPLGDPATNAWLLFGELDRDNHLAYVYREAVNLAHVLNSPGRVHAAMVTPQDVLDCLLFTSSLLLTRDFTISHPLRQSRSELVQFWVHTGLIMTTRTGSGSRADASQDDIISTAEALLEELLHRRLLLLLLPLLHSSNVEIVFMLPNLMECLWDLATSAAPQGYQGFQPRKFVLLRNSRTLGDLKEPENVQGMSLVTEWGNKVPLDDVLLLDDGGGPRYARFCNLRILVLHGLPSFPADDFFLQMRSLRVLVITSAGISFLPNSLFGLPNLRMLLLRDCKSLKAFFVPGANTWAALYGLRVLDLGGSAIRDFPDQAFAHMHNLQELLLGSCSELNSVGGNIPDISSNELIDLPHEPLVTAAPNLRKLLLSDCSQLKTLTPHLYAHPALEELDLRSCHALQEEEIQFKMPMLKVIRLSGSPAIRRLSFTGCSKLEVAELHALQNLESLDLSGTAIKELDLRPFPSKSLIFQGATNLITFPWKMIKHLPEELILDQHMVEASNYIQDPTSTQRRWCDGKGVWMHVRDGRFFRMLCYPEKGTYSQLESSFTQQFYINVAPSVKRGKKEGNTGEFARRVPRQYRGIQVRPKILQKQSPLCRHVEIQGSHAPPRDIHGFLQNTLSLSVSNQHSYKSLSELTTMGSVVEQCQIEKCHGMEAIFECSADSCLLQSVESVWASELTKVVALAVEKGRSAFDWSQGFKNLKHVHLEFCPRLRYVFPPGARHGLQSLEVLEILLCPNLEEVFASPSQESQQAIMLSSSSPTLPFAPRLRIVHLLELPTLVNICHEADKHWPALERFKVRGCWRLKKLPFLAYNRSNALASSSSSSLPTPRTVKIDGEPVWWKRVLEGGGITAKYAFSAGIDVPLRMPKK